MNSIVPSLEMFKDIFDAFTNNFFHGFDLQGNHFNNNNNNNNNIEHIIVIS